MEHIREQWLAPFLEVATGLKQFAWTWLCTPSLDPVNEVFIELETLTAALGPLRGSLRELIIGADYAPQDMVSQFSSLEIRGTLAALTGFAQLRTLVVPWVFYMGFSPDEDRSLLGQLPRGLETLVLTNQLSSHQRFDWNPTKRSDGSIRDDKDDSRIRTRAVAIGLRGFERDAIPNLREILLAWTPQNFEFGDGIMEELDMIGEEYGVYVSCVEG